MHRRARSAATAACLAILAATPIGSAVAQSWPTRPVRLIVPFPPGGNTDIIARIVAPKISEALGQQLVIDNRGGAGSTIGTAAAARAQPDGYTLLMVSAAHVINPAMVRKLPYDSVKDFTALGIVADVPTAFVVHPSMPVKTAQDVIALAKKRPDEINYSTAGRGTVGHLAGELFSSMAGIRLVHVPYKGTGPALVDLLGGQVQMQFASMPAVITHARVGKLRMVAQAGAKRSNAAKDVPTMQESGLQGFIVSSGFSLFAPAKVSPQVVQRVNAALKSAIAVPAIASQLADQGADPVASTPAEHDRFNRAEIEKWIKVARSAKIDPM